MQAFIKDNRLVVNTQVLSNEKTELQEFIEKAETNGVSATTLYDIEGNKAGIAIEIQNSNTTV